MASRSTRITIKNRSDMQFVVSGEGTSLVHGVWSDGGRPEPGSTLLETMDLDRGNPTALRPAPKDRCC
jgi:hypothetical protein